MVSGGGVAPALDVLFAAPAFAATHAVGWLGDGTPPARVPPSFTWDDVARAPSDLLPSANRPGDAAHILFTSGSTGTPKGVVITHDNVRHFIEWAVGYFGTAATDRISGHLDLVAGDDLAGVLEDRLDLVARATRENDDEDRADDDNQRHQGGGPTN